MGIGCGGEFDDVSLSVGTRIFEWWDILFGTVLDQDREDDEFVDDPVTSYQHHGRGRRCAHHEYHGAKGAVFLRCKRWLRVSRWRCTRGRRAASSRPSLRAFSFVRTWMRNYAYSPAGSVGLCYGDPLSVGIKGSSARGVSLNVGYQR
jgi:hypothetical protein